MKTIELQAKSLDEAKEQAASQWGVSADELTATVLEESAGLFGKSKLKVRVEMADSNGEAPKKVATKAPKAAKPAAPKKPKAEKAPEVAVVEAPAEAEAPEVDVVATEADGAIILELIQGILELADLEVEAQIQSIQGRYVNVQLDGKDVAHLIGKNGEALNHFQYLTNVIMSRQHANGVRITLDGNEYRRKREEKLQALAQHVADQVLERQEEAVFDALPAFERRIVHQALQGIEGITTYSEGEEPNRRVVIAPGT